MPSPAKLISIFLEGFREKSLHADLYAKKHKTLNECIYDAIDLDDNCDMYGKDKPISRVDSMSTTTRGTQETTKDPSHEAEAMVEMIMKRMNQVFKPLKPRSIRCEICAGNHPTSYCLPKQNYQAYKPVPRMDKWCEYEQKWTNHETQECYHRIRHLREQGVGQNQPGIGNQAQAYVPRGINQNYGQIGGGERALPILGNQPPLPGTAVVKYIQPEDMNQETALVPIETYGGETRDIYMGSNSSYEQANEMTQAIPEGRYQMDHNTLWFIANGMQKQQGPMGPQPYRVV